jgi:predicted dehydrogenase
MLKVGLIGSGFMGSTHAAAWSTLPVELVGIRSLEDRVAQQLANRYHSRSVASLDELIESVDVVDICVPTDLHYEMALQAARAGKHIICEKPLARTYQQGKEMIAACEASGVMMLVAHVVRFFPEYALAKAAVERGDIGKVAVLRLTRCAYHPRVEWFLDPARSGGLILDLMIHDFDYARWVAGEIESVYVRSVRGLDPTAPEDYALAILKHTNGALSNIEGAWAYPTGMFRTALEIAGDAGLIEHPAGSSVPLEIHLKTTPGSDAPAVGLPSSPLAEDPYTAEIRHFCDLLTGKAATPRVTAQDGLAALRIALAAIESARAGRPVRIEEVQ